jgi:hypothetical protein
MSIINNAQKELQMENKIAGVKKRSANSWVSKYVMEFALLARKLRKGNLDARGQPDQYSARIGRELSKVDAAIQMLEDDPSWALELGESGQEIEDILEFLERKAAEDLANDRTKVARDLVKKTLPQYRVMEKQRVGGLAPQQVLASI